ncbi:MAG: hypothetical protein A3F17_06820 [Gammaproteobacteria bacterium RIFCSPHIGHO2_12_FULL_41_15]|nr:MAG: hypothetical protein A3F17_06820 [Gammaproteobacteria bacterium RIFCSPHIGHO2_12_FULL_41_15]
MNLTANKILIFLTSIFFLLALLAIHQFNLNSDGAHYALYGQHLALSYYDHPPMVGWLEGIAIKIFGVNDFAAMTIPVLASLLTILGIYQLTAYLYPQSKNWIALLAAVGLFNIIMLTPWVFDLLPQSLFILFAGLSAWTLYRITQQDSWINWLLLGLFVGSAGLSDYTVLPFVAGMLLFILIYQRHCLLTVKPYVSVLLALIIFSPVIIWNAEHHFVSFQYQLHHGLNSTFVFKHFITSLALQMLYYNPALVVLITMACIDGFRRGIKEKLCLCLSLPILFLFFYSGGHAIVLPHWPATGYLLLLPMTACYVFHHWHTRLIKIISLIALGFTLTLYIVGYTLIATHFLKRPINKDPLHDLYGWQQAANEANIQLNKLDQQTHTTHELFVWNWHVAGRIAWYAQKPVQVADIATHQFQFWYGKPNRQSDGVMVIFGDESKPAKKNTQPGMFAHCDFLKQLTTTVAGRPFNHFNYYHCSDFLI